MNDPESHIGEEKVTLSLVGWIQKKKNFMTFRFLWVILYCLIPVITFRIIRRPVFLPFSKDLRVTVEAFIQADLIVSTAGGYLYSHRRGGALLVTMYTMALALLANKPLYLFPQSYGPFRYRYEFWLANKLLKKARILMVRERASLDHLLNCGIQESECYVIPDVAFAFKGSPTSDAIEWLEMHEMSRQKGTPLLGVTSIDWGAQYQYFNNQGAYEEALSAAICYFISQYHGKVLLLAQCWGPSIAEDDRISAKRIKQRVSDLGFTTLLVEKPLPPDLLKSVLGQMDMLIGTRMHSNIFALSQGIPVIPIGYLHKTIGIAQSAGIENWVIDINELNGQILINKLSQLFTEKETVQTHLNQRMPEIVRETERAGELVATDYHLLSGDSTNE